MTPALGLTVFAGSDRLAAENPIDWKRDHGFTRFEQFFLAAELMIVPGTIRRISSSNQGEGRVAFELVRLNDPLDLLAYVHWGKLAHANAANPAV